MIKKRTRLLSLVLAFGMFCATIEAGSLDIKAESLGSTIRLEDKGDELADNIERGRCPYTWVKVDGSSCPVLNPKGGMYSIMYDLRYFSSGNSFTKDGYDNSNGCGGNKNLTEHPNFLKAFEQTLSNARKNGTSLVLRFSYSSDRTVGNEPGLLLDGDSTVYHNTELIRQHIKQLSEVINKNKDVVLAVECGMFGPWGEMHSSMYDIDECNDYDPQFSNAIIDRWLNKLDPDIKVLVRAPKHLMGYYGYANNAEGFNQAVANGTLKLNSRLGMYNDGYLGTSTDYGTFGDENEWPYITRDKGIDMLEKLSEVPYGGECAYVDLDTLKSHGSPIYNGKNFMSELYRTHLSYLHNINSEDEVLIKELNHVDVSKSDLVKGLDASDVTPYIDHSYRKFMRDHMGYRILVKESKLSSEVSKDGTFTMSGSMKNVGFGNFLTKKYTEVILKKGDKTYVASVDSFNANDLKSLATKDYKWTFSVPSDIESGNWEVYVRIRNKRNTEDASVKTGIRFANPDCFNTNIRANKIGTIKVSGGNSKGGSGLKEVR